MSIFSGIRIKKPYELSHQQLEIYLLLKERKGMGVHSWEMTNERPDGLAIIDYRRRISDLREVGYSVKNVEKNLYSLEREPEMSRSDVVFIQQEAEKRLYSNLSDRCKLYLQTLDFVGQVREALL